MAEEEGQLEEIQQTLQEQQKELETVKAEKSSQMDDFETKLAQAQSLAAEYEATIREQNQVLTSSVNGAATLCEHRYQRILQCILPSQQFCIGWKFFRPGSSELCMPVYSAIPINGAVPA